MNTSVNLKAKMGRVFVPLARNADGSYAGGLVMVDGQPTKTACTYYAEWYEGQRRVQRVVGRAWKVALQTARSQEHVLKLRAAGEEVESPALLAEEGATVNEAVEAFLRRPNLRHRSYAKYARDLEDFRQYAQSWRVPSIRESHLNKYVTHLQGTGLADASVRDKVRTAVAALREQGAILNTKKVHLPRLTERIPSIYNEDTLRSLFAACTVDERDIFKTFLLTGFREQEVVYLTWADIHQKNKSIAVREKPGFEVKDYEERTVPLFPELAELLADRKKRYPKTRLVFTTKDGKPERHFLRILQRVAYRAGLNCGECLPKRGTKGRTCIDTAMCREFGLHKFRKTYATTLLRDGLDLITVQKLLGHSDIETTRKYLKGFVAGELTERLVNSSLGIRL